MKPVIISGADVTMTPPEGWSEDRHGKCEDVQARKNCDGSFSVGWKPSPADLAKLQAGAAIVLSALGGVPPHFLAVEDVPGNNDESWPSISVVKGALVVGKSFEEMTREEREEHGKKLFEENAERQRQLLADAPKPIEPPAEVNGSERPDVVIGGNDEALGVLKSQWRYLAKLYDASKADVELAEAALLRRNDEHVVNRSRLAAIDAAIRALGGSIE